MAIIFNKCVLENIHFVNIFSSDFKKRGCAFQIMACYYIDTCIWRDYLENREDRFRPLGQWALSLFQLIQENDDVVLYSELVIRELKLRFKDEEITSCLHSLAHKPILVPIGDRQVQEAEIIGRIREVGTADALHAILARDADAILVTRDAHYMDLVDIATIKNQKTLFEFQVFFFYKIFPCFFSYHS